MLRKHTVMERRHKLAEGSILIEAGVLARLLGFRLLRLEADIVLTPAHTVALPAKFTNVAATNEPPVHTERETYTHANRTISQHASGQVFRRHSLAEAQHLLAEAEQSLRQTREGFATA